MAKFDALYPTQPTHVQQTPITFEGSALIRCDEPDKCWHCGDLTSWVDMYFETHLCSEECERAKWTEYIGAFNASAFTNK
jgi:hypothetical protein